jgi:threonine dehydratase
MFTIDELERAAEVVHAVLPGTPQIRWPLLRQRVEADVWAGMSCRVPNPVAVDIINQNADRIVTVTDTEIMEAMRLYFSATHNVAEGAAAAPLAALLRDQKIIRNKQIALIHSGSNIGTDLFASVLAGRGRRSVPAGRTNLTQRRKGAKILD